MKLLLALLAALVAPSEALVLGSHPGSALQARPSHSSAASSLRKIRLQSDPPPVPPPSGRLGATVDQDGKSNVWVRHPTPPGTVMPANLARLPGSIPRGR